EGRNGSALNLIISHRVMTRNSVDGNIVRTTIDYDSCEICDNPIEVGENALAMERYDMDESIDQRLQHETDEPALSDEKQEGCYSREEMMWIRECESYDIGDVSDLNYGPYKGIKLGNSRNRSSDVAFLYPPPVQQISPPLGVDPFAILNSCEGATRKLKGNVAKHFELLFIRFERCYAPRLNLQTIDLFRRGSPYDHFKLPHKSREYPCSLCETMIGNGEHMIKHICDSRHVSMMNGDACADSFDFWSKVVEEVSMIEETAPVTILSNNPPICSLCGTMIISGRHMVMHISTSKHISMMNGSVCADAFEFWSKAMMDTAKVATRPVDSDMDFDKISSDAPARVYPQITPPPGVDPFALLSSCQGAERKLGGDVYDRFKQLIARFERCNKKRLSKQTKGMFSIIPHLACSLCNSKFICIASMIMHICGIKHISQMKGAVCADAFDFWLKAIDAETKIVEPHPAPQDGYSRGEMLRIRKGKKYSLHLIGDLDYIAYDNIKLRDVAKERTYTQVKMRRLKYLPGYSWQMDVVPSKDSFLVMDHWFPDNRRTRNRMLSFEYWVWHNVNAQQSFAVYFGFFPFHLPYFDAEAFICFQAQFDSGCVSHLSALSGAPK
ncbi:hypothetical protein PMAYCL1PPCAC_08139, partial [Pristionchus mayeri]